MKLLKSLFGIKTRKTVRLTLGRRGYKIAKAYMDIGFEVFFDVVNRVWVAVKTVLV